MTMQQSQHEEIETLRERVRQLEALLVPDKDLISSEWQLTPTERRLFGILSDGKLKAKEVIFQAFYYDRPGDLPDIKLVDVYVHRLRRKLTPFGVCIKTAWGIGYQLFHERKAA